MSVKNRKLCPNCEGSVHIHAIKCPYCGADLAESLVQEPPPVVEEIAPPPAYAPPAEVREEVPPPAYSPRKMDWEEVPLAEPPPSQPSQASDHLDPKSVLLPMLLIVPGAFFFLFGMMLCLFSEEGVLTLRWNAKFWYLYLAAAVPLLYLGWRYLHRESEEEVQPQEIEVKEEGSNQKFGPSDDLY